MKTYRLLLNKNNVLIITIVGIPLIGMALLFALLFNLPDTTPDWIIITMITAFLIAMSGLVVLISIRHLTVPCRLSLSNAGLSYEFERRSIFYRRNNFFSAWENIANISENINNGQGSFYRISFQNPDFTINLSAIKGETDQAEDFFAELVYYQDSYNLSHAETPIKARNFYESFWARFITWLFYLMMLAVIVISFTDLAPFEWLRTISLFCFGTAWIGNYYKNTKKLY